MFDVVYYAAQGALTFEAVHEVQSVSIQVKAVRSTFLSCHPLVLFIMLYKVVPAFDPANKTIHLNVLLDSTFLLVFVSDTNWRGSLYNSR